MVKATKAMFKTDQAVKANVKAVMTIAKAVKAV